MRIAWAALAVSSAVVLAPTAGAQPLRPSLSTATASSVTQAGVSAAKPKTYANCTALNKVYKHGVGRKGARDKTSGKPVKNFTVSTTVYNLNKKSDRDKDGIACEKR